MHHFNDLFQTADWKEEKHAPSIELIGKAQKGKNIAIALEVGKEIAHPNTTAHHIAWIDAYFLPEGGKFPYHLGRFEFASHGASPEGPDTSTVYTLPGTTVIFKTDKPGEVIAFSHCNIHGLWASSMDLKVE